MAVCPACGARSAADERFCAACGARLYAQGRRPGNERTAVAVLLCDLVGRTPDEPWDAEDVDHLRRRFSSMSREIVTRFGGVVETYAGDAVLAVFGFPTARDDDAERAVRAAFDLVDEASTLRWPDGKPVQAGAAVNAGEDYPRLDVDSASGPVAPDRGRREHGGAAAGAGAAGRRVDRRTGARAHQGRRALSVRPQPRAEGQRRAR